ncbi:MAG: BatA domain-containing protein [Acidobacteriota bacterium]
MGLLTPWFLAGLAALAVPVLLHLTRRRAKQAVEFPSLMFLSQVPYRSLRRRRLEELLLLALRCAALTLLVFAFARPLLPGSPLGAAGVEQTELILAVDRSASMTVGDRWTRAVAAAQDALAGTLEDDAVRLVLFDQTAEAVTDAGVNGATAATEILSGTLPSSRETDYFQAIELSRRLVLDSELPRQRVVFISDLQRRGFEGSADLESFPAGVDVEIVDVGDELPVDWVNLQVLEADFERSRSQGREQVLALVRVRNTGTQAQEGTLRLVLDGREIDRQSVNVEPLSSQRVNFDPFLLEDGRESVVRLRLDAEGDLLDKDDEYVAVLAPSQGIAVLLVEANGRRRANSLFVEKALSFGRSPVFRVQRVRASGLSEELVSRHSVVVLQDSIGDLDDPSWDWIRSHVERGGGLLAVAGRSFSGLPQQLSSLGLPNVAAANRGERSRRRIAQLDYGHPALAPFERPRSGDFTGATFFLRHSVEAGNARVLARFDDGSPALVQAADDEAAADRRGRVMLWATSLDTSWNDLALQPVFLPFLQRLGSYLAGFSPPPTAYTAGQIASLAVDPDEGSWLVVAPGGGQSQLAAAEELVLPLSEQGLYTLRHVEGEDDERLLAVNMPPAEADLRRVDSEEFASSLASVPATNEAAEAASAQNGEPERQQIWWVLLAAAGALLILESLVAARRSSTLGKGAVSAS